MVERVGPGGGELLRAGLAAEVVGALGTHVDALGGGLDRSGLGQRGDEGALAVGGPAVDAVLAGDRREVARGAVRWLLDLHRAAR